MPIVVIRTGDLDQSGCEETISEYICDEPGCPNVATRVLGLARDVAAKFAVCAEHASELEPDARTRSDSEMESTLWEEENSQPSPHPWF